MIEASYLQQLYWQLAYQQYHVWKHSGSGDYLVRTTSYSLPSNLHDHIDLIQPTTMFSRFKKQKSTIFKVSTAEKDALAPASKSDPIVDSVSGVTVDASCNKIITITCLQQLYNAVGFVPSANVGNSIGITGYLVNIISLDSRMEPYIWYRNNSRTCKISNHSLQTRGRTLWIPASNLYQLMVSNALPQIIMAFMFFQKVDSTIRPWMKLVTRQTLMFSLHSVSLIPLL